jgi:hypothetical protein
LFFIEIMIKQELAKVKIDEVGYTKFEAMAA